MSGKNPERTIISLDIGSGSIKMVKGAEKEQRICVFDFACRKYPAGKGAVDLVSQHILELLTSVADAKQIRKARIHSTISGKKLCIRVVKLPVMPEEEINQAIRSKIRKYISSDLEQVIFSFSVLGEIQEKGIKRLEVVFAAVQKTVFDEYLQFFKLTGIEPEAITSACFSGWNLVRETGLNKGVTSLLLINIETHETDLTVYRENRFVFTRNISIGDRDFTDILKGQSRWSLDEPEDIKLLWGLGEQARPLEEKERADVMKIREHLQNEAAIFCKEIELTAHHYYQIAHGKKIDKCVILGEGSRIAGLIDFLKQKLEIPVEALHIPDAKLELSMDKREEFKRNLPLYTQSLGALLIGPDDINLLTPMRPQTKKGIYPIRLSALSRMTTVVIIVSMFLGLIIFTFLKGLNLYYQFQIKSYKIKRDKFQERTVQLMQIKRKMDILDLEKRLYRHLIKDHPAYPVIIAEICKAIPSEKIVLDELKFYSTQKKVRSLKDFSPIKFIIAGGVLGTDAADSETTRFILALEQSGYFENISLAIQTGVSPSDALFDRGFADRSAGRELLEEESKSSFIIDGIVKIEN